LIDDRKGGSMPALRSTLAQKHQAAAPHQPIGFTAARSKIQAKY